MKINVSFLLTGSADKWGFWPENMDPTKRFDYLEYAFEIGDTVEVNWKGGRPSYQTEFYMNHRNEDFWLNNPEWGSSFRCINPDTATPNSFEGTGIVLDRWVHNQVRYYRVISNDDYSNNFWTERVRTRDELRKAIRVHKNWENGGSI